MIAIRNYNDTKIELSVAKTELNRLLDKKERLYSKYFPTTTKTPATRKITIKKKNGKTEDEYRLKDENALLRGSHVITDPMTDYMAGLEKIDEKTGKSLNQSLQEQQNEVRILEYYLKLMECDIANLKGVEHSLYYAIVIEPSNTNKSISKIIEEFAEKNDKDVRTIWRYYENIETFIKKLENVSELSVKSML